MPVGKNSISRVANGKAGTRKSSAQASAKKPSAQIPEESKIPSSSEPVIIPVDAPLSTEITIAAPAITKKTTSDAKKPRTTKKATTDAPKKEDPTRDAQRAVSKEAEEANTKIVHLGEDLPDFLL